MKREKNRDAGRRNNLDLPKKRYERPHLIVHGTVEFLTRGVTNAPGDGPVGSA